MRPFLRMATALLAAGSLGFSAAAEVQLRPATPELQREVESLLGELTPKTSSLTLKLNPAGGPRIVTGNVSGVPFNPDSLARTSGEGQARLIEINPAAPLPQREALKRTLAAELDLTAWTPEAARQRFSGADLNGDGQVDLVDLALLMQALGGSGRGDLNGDGKVDMADVKLFSEVYRIRGLSPAPAPSPAQAGAPQPSQVP